MAKPTWYDRGHADALDGQVSDPPYERGNRHHDSYVEGYEDGQRQLDSEADYDRANSRPRKL
ncbi:hypothetical protein M9978_08275 [Sphingomonas sp. MG17]|uniref:Uncharacterized protein n=1 Tax=Sphingomonas tagetis TaxID=2949092 RepID=A0A9X2KP97_9SPHN|nr:hypothetical protein [Sphingomonas tagetis]MCP3730423.1 hypothetical protein [Sphingomonas tagetis]